MRVLLIFLMVIWSSYVRSDDKLQSYESFLDWRSAAYVCVDSVGGPLVNLAMVPFNGSVWDKLKISMTTDVDYWSGGYHAFTKFHWYFGCYDYDNAFNMTFLKTTLLFDNSVKSCSQFCGLNITFIGIRGVMCFCLPDKISTLPSEIPSKCPKYCSADDKSRDQCGGDIDISVYKKLKPSEITPSIHGTSLDDYQNGSCVYIKKTSSNDIVWGTADCKERFMPLCMKHGVPKLAIVNDTFVSVRNLTTWDDANMICRRKGMTLAYVSRRETRLGIFSTLPPTIRVWIGLYRHQMELWIEDDTPKFTPSSCVAVYKNPPTGSLKRKTISCSTDLKSICQASRTLTADGAIIGTPKPTTTEKQTTVPTTVETTTLLRTTQAPTISTTITEEQTTFSTTTETTTFVKTTLLSKGEISTTEEQSTLPTTTQQSTSFTTTEEQTTLATTTESTTLLRTTQPSTLAITTTEKQTTLLTTTEGTTLSETTQPSKVKITTTEEHTTLPTTIEGTTLSETTQPPTVVITTTEEQTILPTTTEGTTLSETTESPTVAITTTEEQTTLPTTTEGTTLSETTQPPTVAFTTTEVHTSIPTTTEGTTLLETTQPPTVEITTTEVHTSLPTTIEGTTLSETTQPSTFAITTTEEQTTLPTTIESTTPLETTQPPIIAKTTTEQQTILITTIENTTPVETTQPTTFVITTLEKQSTSPTTVEITTPLQTAEWTKVAKLGIMIQEKVTSLPTTIKETSPSNKRHQNKYHTSTVESGIIAEQKEKAKNDEEHAKTELKIVLIVFSVIFLLAVLIILFLIIRYKRRRRVHKISRENQRSDHKYRDEEEQFIKAYRLSAEQSNPSPAPLPRIDVERSGSVDDIVVHVQNGELKKFDSFGSVPWIDASRSTLDKLSVDDTDTTREMTGTTSFSAPEIDNLGLNEEGQNQNGDMNKRQSEAEDSENSGEALLEASSDDRNSVTLEPSETNYRPLPDDVVESEI